MSRQLNELLNDLREILHREPGPETWEDLKERLAQSCRTTGPISEVAIDYARQQLQRHWPEGYAPLLEIYLASLDHDAQEVARKQREQARGRRIAYRVNRLLMTPMI